jgi:hypothetical protein
MNYADKAAALDARADDLEGRLATFAAEARKHAVAASAGDRDALRRICEIDSTCHAMRREANTARVAAEQLRERERAAAAERERADQERRHADARQLADQVLALNVEIDSGFAQLAGLFTQRAELINQLAASGCIQSHITSRLLNRFGPTAVARRSGLHRYVEIGHIEPVHVLPLSESNAVLRASFTAQPLPEHAA